VDERNTNFTMADAFYAEFAKSAGISVKQLRTWTARTSFDSKFLHLAGGRVSCEEVALLCAPVMKKLSDLPAEGILPFAYESLSAGLYPYSGAPRADKGQKSALKFYLAVLSRLLDLERESAFDPLLDFLPVTEEEIAASPIANQCALFSETIKKCNYRELLRMAARSCRSTRRDIRSACATSRYIRRGRPRARAARGRSSGWGGVAVRTISANSAAAARIHSGFRICTTTIPGNGSRTRASRKLRILPRTIQPGIWSLKTCRSNL
jgi:hypothetical protein